MQRSVHNQAKQYLRKHRRWKRWQKIVMSLACVVVFCTVYALILPAITARTNTSCGHEEHVHGDECYENKLVCEITEDASVHEHSEECMKHENSLVCGQEERTGHTHGNECYQTEQTNICGLEENEEHTHEDSCYQVEQIQMCGQEESAGHTHIDECYEDNVTYICGMEEGQNLTGHTHSDECYKKELGCELEEHEHELACYSDPNADVETEEIWKKTFENVELTGDWSEDLIAIAESQLGYEESTENYIVENDEKQGYTRYGDWYGNKYGEWCAMYVSFCLNYAEVEGVPFEAGCQNWINKLREEPYELYRKAGDYIPERGDLIFFNWDELSDADHVGIVVEYIEETEHEPAQIKTIEGNTSHTVKYKTYEADSSTMMGFVELPEEPKEEVEEPEEVVGEVEEETEEEITEELQDTVLTAVIYEDSSYNTVAEDTTVITITGKLPEGAYVRAYPVELELEDQNVYYAYDITIFLEDGSVYEPEESAPMTVKISSPEYIQEEDAAEPGMYYIPEEGEPEPIGSTIEEDGVTFTAEHFSVYALIAPSDANKVSSQRALRNAINNRTEYIQLQSDITVDGEALNVPSNANITIDLNGYVLTNARGSALFNITNGGTLTIGDSRDPGVTVTNDSGALYGREGNVSVASDKTATLTYYVTTSRVTNSATGATAESVQKHTVTTRGAIVGNDQPVFNVTNGTLNIDSGMIRSGTGRAINQSGGTVNIKGGYICGFNQPYDKSSYSYGQALKYSANDFGGAIKSTGGSLNLSDTGVLATNKAALGGAVYVGSGVTFTISGGYISGNRALYDCEGWKGESDAACVGGGGIIANGTINMSDGYITHNIADGSQYFDGGGGILLKNGGAFNISGGYVTGNKAQGGGGLKTTFKGKTTLSMTGGHVSSNAATAAEGAGFSIDRDGFATILAGYITNNILVETVHWGGGGLFCADGATMKLECALITNNRAGGFGGGVSGCPTGHLYLYVERGCAIYDNTDVVELNGNSDGKPNFVNGGAKDEIDTSRCVGSFLENGHSDYFCALDSTVTNAMLGGSFANWQGTADYDVVNANGQKDIVLSATEVMGLKAHPSEQGKQAAQRVATLYINGNYSYTHGGGIMCNGNLVVGIPEDVIIPVHLSVQGSKSFINNSGSSLSLKDNNFLFTVIDKNGTEVAEGRCDENGKITFDKQIAIEEEGTYVYEVKEKIPENANSDVQYDTKCYRITVVVEKNQGTAWYGDTWKYVNNITKLTVEASDGNGTWQPVVNNTATQDGVVVVLPDEKMISFVNTRTDVIEMKVIKKWIGKISDINAIIVKLYRDGEVIQTQELNDSNNWQYTWSGLPTKDDNGNAYKYHIEEEHVDGYITTYEETNESVIHTTTITNTNVNDARFNLDLTKVSEEEPELTLPGAEFELEDSKGNLIPFIGEDGIYEAAEANASGASTIVTTNADGKLFLKELPAGTYILREVKAPEGYGLMEDKEIVLDEYSEPTVTLTVEDPEKTYEIPETGGTGTNVFITGGLLLMLISLLCGYGMNRKSERRVK